MKCYFYPHEQGAWLKEHECADTLIADNQHGVIAAIYISPQFRDKKERDELLALLAEATRREETKP